jgi:hypothetical protein
MFLLRAKPIPRPRPVPAGSPSARQGFGCQQVAAATRPVHMLAAPNLCGPIDRTLSPVERRPHGDHHRWADRLETEFFLAPPAHSNRCARLEKGDHRRFSGCIVGAVVAGSSPDPGRASPRSPPDESSAYGPTPPVAERRPGNASTPAIRRRDRPPARRMARSRRGRRASD